ncbi:thiosulfate sulfurtransferase 18-like isoform X2 [Hordeum vulgare subsp. vulgare]|uniref:thiosulfate sulfurtransferase 18-like isoform X2 n=1 Tax=Hordeum vulgare subsp. vulgare TaxID=112509 RepID=UPI001D1A52B9|nr:thiosulfate sulfurtransferase 18-like isoform X2 [Hordeum vulgare subsp. vulgare]
MAPPPHENEMSRSESAPATAVKTVDVQTAETPAVGVTTVDVQTAATPAVGVTTVDVQTAARELQEQQGGMAYLDVRTEEEMGKGHVVGGSLNVPYFFVTPQGTREKNPRFVEQVASLFTTDQHILIGCQSGKRSELACVDLLAAYVSDGMQGFMNVKNVGGGYAAWLQSGLPVTVAVPTPESAAEI